MSLLPAIIHLCPSCFVIVLYRTKKNKKTINTQTQQPNQQNTTYFSKRKHPACATYSELSCSSMKDTVYTKKWLWVFDGNLTVYESCSRRYTVHISRALNYLEWVEWSYDSDFNRWLNQAGIISVPVMQSYFCTIPLLVFIGAFNQTFSLFYNETYWSNCLFSNHTANTQSCDQQHKNVYEVLYAARQRSVGGYGSLELPKQSLVLCRAYYSRIFTDACPL